MTCDQFTPIGKHGEGYCQVMYLRVYPVKPGQLCLCDYCRVDGDGKRFIDPDVYFHGNGLIRLHSADVKKLEKDLVEAASMPPATPSPKLAAVSPRSESPKPKPNPKPAAKKVSLLDFKE